MKWSLDTFAQQLVKGDRRTLARLISCAESRHPAQRFFVQNVIELASTLVTRTAFRIGFAGAAGAGKSTLINSLGCKIAEDHYKLAVLTIDPSSAIRGGSLLGDAVRMQQLTQYPQVYVRTTPSGLHTGGISKATPIAVQLCELAGYDIILIESLGSGQIEFQLAQSVDLFFWLTTPGAGDDMQGMKQGVLEWVDGILITQADRGRENIAQESKAAYEHGVGFLRESPYVGTMSTLDDQQVKEYWCYLKNEFKQLTGKDVSSDIDLHSIHELKRHRESRAALMRQVQTQQSLDEIEASYKNFNDICSWLKQQLSYDDHWREDFLQRFIHIFGLDAAELNWGGQVSSAGLELSVTEKSRLSLILPEEIFCQNHVDPEWPETTYLPLQQLVFIPLSLMTSDMQGSEYASIFNTDFQFLLGYKYIKNDARGLFVGHEPHPELAKQWSRALQGIFFEAQLTQLQHSLKRKVIGDTDTLTGLGNRESFKTKLEQFYLQANYENRLADNEDAFVFALDLDDFRQVNEALGLAAGDRVLKVVAKVLGSLVADRDYIARFSGDEFFILKVLEQTPYCADVFAEQIQNSVKHAVANKIKDIKHQSCHIGCVALQLQDSSQPMHLMSANEVLRAAGSALFAAKSLDTRNVFMYEMILKQQARSALFNKNELYKAMADEQFIYQAQPLYDNAKGRCIGAELLLRWNHPTRGILPAGEFIASASDLGIIQHNDLRLIFKHLHQILDLGKRFGVVFHLNLSAQLFAKQDIIDFIIALEQQGALPYIHFEITEHDFIDRMSLLHQFIARVREGGSEVWVDDFGIGYSGLRYLDLLAIDGVKIDQSFIQRIDQPRTQTLLKGMLSMLNSLGLDMLAEGVESISQAEMLSQLGCHHQQGLLYGHAMSFETLGQILEDEYSRD